MTLRAIKPTFICAVGLLATICMGPVAAAEPDRQVYFGAFFKPVCDQAVPGFESETANTYRAWARQNQEAVATLEADADFQSKRRQALVLPPPEIADAKSRELANTCSGLIEIFEGAAPANASLATPERTWESFRAALRAADRPRLKTCLAGSARRQFLPRLQAMTDQQLKRMEAGIAEMKVSTRQGDFQEAVVVQRDGMAGIVKFFKVGANWKIGEM